MSRSNRRRASSSLLAALLAAASTSPASAEDDAELATELANPLANLISIPFQGNYNAGMGPTAEGDSLFVNIQPVVPFSLNDDWNLISRTILPVIWQDEIFPGAGTQGGLGNAVQSLFFSPARVTNGFSWGVGPVFLLPTHTDEFLGRKTWGAGPTAAGLWQGDGWTVGMLANHIHSVAGEIEDEVDATFLQPFISYTTPDAWTFSLNTESTYDWTSDEWSVPVNASVSKLVKIGGRLPVSFFGGVRYWVDAPEMRGPEDWGARFGFTVLLPRAGARPD
jgi:hypothetical protein